MAAPIRQQKTLSSGSQDLKPSEESSNMQSDKSSDALELEDSISSVGSSSPSQSDSQDSLDYEDSSQDGDMQPHEEEPPRKLQRTAPKYELPDVSIDWQWFVPVYHYFHVLHTERLN